MNHAITNKKRDIKMQFFLLKKKLENGLWIVLQNGVIDLSTLQEVFSSVSECLSCKALEKNSWDEIKAMDTYLVHSAAYVSNYNKC